MVGSRYDGINHHLVKDAPQFFLDRTGQGGGRGVGGRLKSGHAPIAALFKAVTRGILPAYLTMAGQTKIRIFKPVVLPGFNLFCLLAALSTPDPQDDVAWLR